MYAIPENLHLRPVRMEDLEAVVAFKNVIAVLLTGEADVSLEETRNDWNDPDNDVEANTRIVETEDGQIAGLAEFYPDEPPVVLWLDVYVHPDYENTGLGEKLVQWVESRAQETIEKAPPEARVALRAYTYQEDARYYQPLLERSGLQRIRHSYRMRIDLDNPLQAPVVPEGFTIRTAVRGQDERDVRRVGNESFRDHFGFIERDVEEDFAHWLHTWRDYDPSLWWLAFAGDELVGICLCDSKFADKDEIAWVATLAVLRDYRKHGLGRALLLTAFEELNKRGKKAVGLGVDASSLTNAVTLYENAGMYIWQRFDLYEKELRGGVDMTTHSLEA